MRVLSILFSTDMVRAILDGRKTVTRRLMKPQMPDHCPNCMHIHNDFIYDRAAQNVYCTSCGEPLYNGGFPYKSPYQPGDILYVRETWGHGYDGGTYIYKADDKLAELPAFKKSSKLIYKPSIHMPKEAARIWLKVTDVKVERLKDIDTLGCQHEGIDITRNGVFKRFSLLWDSTIKKADIDRYSWNANPWVWVIEFELCEKPEEDESAGSQGWRENFMKRFCEVD